MTQDGMLIGNGAFDLILGDEGALLLNTINGYYEMVDSSGEFVFQPLNQLSHNGYTFQAGHYDEATGKLPIYIDGILFEPTPDFFYRGRVVFRFQPGRRFCTCRVRTGPRWSGGSPDEVL